MNQETYVDLDTNTATTTTTVGDTSASTSDLYERPTHQSNRAQRRKKVKIRLTKPLKYIRGKFWYGDINVTDAIRHNIPVNTFVYVNKFGYGLKDIKNALQ